MKYSKGDIVRFIGESDGMQKGKVLFIEKSRNENIYYINSFSGWAYRVTEKRILSRVPIKIKYNIKINKC